MDFSASGERTFNNLRAFFAAEIPRKEFFNSHGIFRQLFRKECIQHAFYE